MNIMIQYVYFNVRLLTRDFPFFIQKSYLISELFNMSEKLELMRLIFHTRELLRSLHCGA